ncbi:MAG: hypothetical protein HOW73_06660 [Polyangiaceae bacterium]|nr:hypothetical protein [Polyangiaceae bacterium]
MRALCLFLPLTVALASITGCSDDTTSPGGGGAGEGGSGAGATGGTSDGGSPPSDPPEECGSVTEITQSGDSKLYSTLSVGFEFLPSMGSGDKNEVVAVSPKQAGVVPTDTTAFMAFDGDVVSTASVDAVDDLINAGVDAMDGRLFVAIAGTVTITGSPSVGTQFKGRVTGTLSDVYYIDIDADFMPLPGGECFHLAEGTFDASSFQADCEAPVDIANTPSGGACFDWENKGHSCNPITNEGCNADEICDWAGYFDCFPVVGNEVGLCGDCQSPDTACQVGMTCDNDGTTGKCHRYCCTDEDCGPSGACIAYAFAPIGVGVCMSP